MPLPVDTQILLMKVERFLSMSLIKNSMKIAKQVVEEEKSKLESHIKFVSRYFSKDYIQALLDGQVSAELGGETVEASILFMDLRNSTGIAEKITPQQFARLISEIFTDVMDLIFATGGSVNKILGDGIMATFGAPFPKENDALNATQTALKIRQYLSSYNEFRPEFLDEEIKAGIGIATGPVFAGNIGSVNRMEFSVMGDPVNLAARLESLTKYAGLDILVDGNTRVKLADKVRCKKVKFTKIRGKINEVKIYYPTKDNEV